MGLDLVENAFVSESLSRSPLGHFIFGCQAPDAGKIEILHLHGTPEQKEKYLGPLVQGKIRSCFSMTEVEMPGSNPVMMDTTAVKDGAEYVIHGQTKDERFRSLIVVAHALEAEANKTIEQSGL